MTKAVWNNIVIAESDDTIVVEGNHYFPPHSINRAFFKASNRHTTCPWKGVASYFDIEAGGKVNEASAWYYPDPKAAANQIKDYVAFWRGVRVEP